MSILLSRGVSDHVAQPSASGAMSHATTVNTHTTTPASSYRDRDSSSPAFSGHSVQYPSSETMLHGYHHHQRGQTTSFDLTPPSSTPRTSRNPLSSPNATDDPIAMQLLVETALEDSKDFQVLPWEELEDLKREIALLQSRIDAGRRKLALETKVRDAARSLNRLYTSPTPYSRSTKQKIPEKDKKRDTVDRAESELAASTRRCEELGRELYAVEQRFHQSQLRMLRHTAGVLQMTYAPNKHAFNGYHAIDRPESPMSLETDPEFGLEEDILYGRPEHLDGILEELRADRPLFRTAVRKTKAPAVQTQIINSVNSKLEELNAQLGEVLQSTGSGKPAALAQSPPDTSRDLDVEDAIHKQLELLSQGLQDIAHEHQCIQQDHEELTNQHLHLQRSMDGQQDTTSELIALQARHAETEAELRSHTQNATQIMTHLRSVNAELSDILESSSSDEMPSVPHEDDGAPVQLQYTQSRTADLKALLASMKESADAQRKAGLTSKSRADESEAVLQGLWQIILADEEDHRQWKREARELQGSKAVAPEADADAVAENFSLQAFSRRVQTLLSSSHELRTNQLDLLQRIQHHHEQLSRAVDPATDPAYQQMRTDLERAEKLHLAASETIQEQEQQLAERDEYLQNLHDEHDKAIAQLDEKHQALILSHSNALGDLQARQDEARGQTQALSKDLELATAAQATAEQAHADVQQQHSAMQASHAEATAALSKAQQDAATLETEVVRLTTELTIAKADLDAAHGSRQQRALELQSEAQQKLEESQKLQASLETEIASLRAEKELRDASSTTSAKRVEELSAELEATIAEFEELTRASVEAEKEREAAESLVDKLRMDVESLETRLCEDRLDAVGGLRTPEGSVGPGSGMGGGSVAGTGLTVLRNEFKKMMRDARAEHIRSLRAEQEEKRRLEAHIRGLRKGQIQAQGQTGATAATHSPALSLQRNMTS